MIVGLWRRARQHERQADSMARRADANRDEGTRLALLGRRDEAQEVLEAAVAQCIEAIRDAQAAEDCWSALRLFLFGLSFALVVVTLLAMEWFR